MEKDRGYRVIAIVALCVAVVGLSLGFAAFTRDLNITFSDSNVNVSGELDIKFLASNDINDTSMTMSGYAWDYSRGDGAGYENENISGNTATISSDGTTINGLGATFNNKDQTVEYDFYIYNNSEYDAYLKGIDFLNYTGAETNKVCTAKPGTTQSLVDDACEDVHVGIVADINGSGVFSMDEVVAIDASSNGFTSLKISKGEMIRAHIMLGYVGEVLTEEFGLSGGTSLLPNGDFKINFGDIKFSFSSLEG